MRAMGRRRSDASPVSSETKGCAASTPASMRMVEPELPQSSGALGPAGSRPALYRDDMLSPIMVHGDPQRSQALQGAGAVAAGREVVEAAGALGERRQHRVAMADALVAGQPQVAFKVRRGVDRAFAHVSFESLRIFLPYLP